MQLERWTMKRAPEQLKKEPLEALAQVRRKEVKVVSMAQEVQRQAPL
jgi:hypothetical protein